MMLEVYRTRPILAWSLTGIGALVLFWLFWPKGGATASAGPAYNPNQQTDAAINANAAYSIAQLQAQYADKALDRQNALDAAALAVQSKLGELGYQNAASRDAQDYDLGKLSIAANLQSLSINDALQIHINDVQANLINNQNNINAALNSQLIQANLVTSGLSHGISQTTLTKLLAASKFTPSPSPVVGP